MTSKGGTNNCLPSLVPPSLDVSVVREKKSPSKMFILSPTSPGSAPQYSLAAATAVGASSSPSASQPCSAKAATSYPPPQPGTSTLRRRGSSRPSVDFFRNEACPSSPLASTFSSGGAGHPVSQGSLFPLVHFDSQEE
eukprot:CAMPEP_0113953130 /NCGR_PEP_ID=MMETSP1339-20121228/90815_1 /TAXON_ID=94617 /ORGANISM="Fibrocapsa japonica" /LENGTH=137 /DNA_ID=CAMNT_0000961843 /DNA_START=355 /DNA_END=768 /DNA_ORIENTATION=- /assembly_acc=CAM_ASM_000762